MTEREKIARRILYASGVFDTVAEIKANLDHPLVMSAYREADRQIAAIGESARRGQMSYASLIDPLKAEIERLRERAHNGVSELHSLREENSRLRAALQPFADYAPPLPSDMPDDFRITFGSDSDKRQLTIGDCRCAARALDESAKEENAYPTVIPRSNNNETGSP